MKSLLVLGPSGRNAADWQLNAGVYWGAYRALQSILAEKPSDLLLATGEPWIQHLTVQAFLDKPKKDLMIIRLKGRPFAHGHRCFSSALGFSSEEQHRSALALGATEVIAGRPSDRLSLLTQATTVVVFSFPTGIEDRLTWQVTQACQTASIVHISPESLTTPMAG